MSLNADTSNTATGVVQMAINGSPQGSNYQVLTPGVADSGNYTIFSTPLNFNAGDRVSFYTTDTGGGDTDDTVVACWIVYD